MIYKISIRAVYKEGRIEEFISDYKTSDQNVANESYALACSDEGKAVSASKEVSADDLLSIVVLFWKGYDNAGLYLLTDAYVYSQKQKDTFIRMIKERQGNKL